MNPDEYSRMFSLEDHYWWFVGRRDLALGLLRRTVGNIGSMEAGRRGSVKAERREAMGSGIQASELPCLHASNLPLILDLGCGTGVVSREAAGFAKAVSLDMSPLALRFTQERKLCRLVKARGEELPFADASFDGILGLDIFEHIEDDAAALREAHRVLKSGGALILTVPAFMSLWGPHDVALMHFRRYRRRELRQRLTEAGFENPRISYSVFFLFPVVWLFRQFEKRKRGDAKASLPQVPGWVNRLLIGLQRFEARLIRWIPLPWGSSLVAVARK